MKHLSLGICTDLFLLVLCFNYSVSSQNDLLRFKSYNLPEKTPILDCIYEDSQGFLWFGTYGGLYRYDGYEFEHFTHDPDNGKSLGDNKVRCLLEDDWGNLLIGTQVGLYVLDLGSRIFHQVTGMDTQTVHVMIKGEEGDFWVVCEEGIFKVRVDDIKREYDILKSWNIHSAATACLSDKGDFYFSDGEKLYVIDTSNQLDLIPVLSRKAYHGERINTVDIDSEGNFWMTSELGIHSYSIEFDSLLQFVPWPNPGLPGFLIGMLEYKKGHFLINTMHGLMDFNSINSSFRDVLIDGRSSIESEERLVPTYVMCLSKTGKIFLSLLGKGDWICDLNRKQFRFIKTDLFNQFQGPGIFPEMYAFDEDSLLISDSVGHRLMDLKTGELRDFSLLSTDEGPSWLTCFDDHDRKIWIGSDYGVFQLDKDHGEVIKVFPKSPKPSRRLLIRDVYEDSKKNLWIATWGEGLYLLDLNTGILKLYDPFPSIPPTKNGIWSCRYLYEDRAQNMWIGCREGLLRYNSSLDSFILYRHELDDPESMSENTSFCIYEDSVGYIWSGSYGGGLNRLDPKTGKFIHFSVNDGLLGNNIFSLIPDDKGFLWIVSYKGITRFNPYTHQILNLTEYNGLGSSRYDAFMYGKNQYTGDLLFLGDRGIDIFNPDSIHLSDYKPPLVFTGFELFNEPVAIRNAGEENSDTFRLDRHISYTDEIRLNYDHRVFTIAYAALDYAGPENIQYAYQLEGFDRDWQYVDGKRSATYTNLDPDSYEFRVKSTNADGIWNDEYKTLSLVVAPPWWETPIAYILYICFLVALVYLFWRYQRRRWTLQTALQMQEKESLRLKELDTFKSNLYTNITHEFRTPLTVINGMLELARTKPKEWMEDSLRTIEVQSAKLLEMVNQMLTLQKLETGKVIYEPIKDDIIAFINHLSEPFEFQAKSKGLDFYIHHEYAECNMDFDPGKLEMVLVNLISNAIKFTNKGRITLHTELTDDNQLDIRISDTGIGIHQDQIAHIFSRFYQADQSTTRFGEGTGIGLSLVKDLVPIMHGTIEVKSELAQGTEFLLRLTISRKAARQSLQLSNTGKIPENGIPVNVPAAKKRVKPKATILFIEDHKDVRHYLRAVFSDEYHVLEAHHGDQGVLMARQNIPDLIVSDIMMPQKDGYDVCQAIHDDPLTSHIPIILLTAKADVQSKIIGYEKGADAYLEKPFHPKELDAQINMLLVQRKRLQLKYQESPSGEPSLQQISREDPFLTELCTLLYEHIAEDDFGIKEICIQMLVSRSQLHNKVKGVTGLSTSLFIRKLRLEEARKLIYSTDLSVAEIAYQVGFKDPNFFSRVYRKEFGKSPSEGRR